MARAPLWRVASCAGAMTHQLGALGGVLIAFSGGVACRLSRGAGERDHQGSALPLSPPLSGEIGGDRGRGRFPLLLNGLQAKACAHDTGNVRA